MTESPAFIEHNFSPNVRGVTNQVGAYSSKVYNRSSLENLADRYIVAIGSLIEHCQSEEAFG